MITQSVLTSSEQSVLAWDGNPESELRKFDGVRITKQPKLLRMAGIDDVKPISFVFDKAKGYHVSKTVQQNETVTDAMRQNALKELASHVFHQHIPIKYRDAIEKIRDYLKRGETIAKNNFQDLKDGGMIIKSSDGWGLNPDMFSDIED